ncbi:hypothetical protein PACILC2_00800 [Paenibacillus cisolokensis]|uniref:Uncharacterized protein n=1 Tax=Paenibacillus cisolokensis TaxID=1658519 RepID=A0ABQ4N017_9BACL|nr:hypothetical protein [Paenibacillus cisolokensis]GIQ61512.1 hypothetical protein PACILC2_00800 [Paenibacillus cisolokensis]
MPKYRLTICREVWGYVEIDAPDESEALRKYEDGDYESDFVETKLGNESVYNMEEGESHDQ